MTTKTKAQVAKIFTENNFDGATFQESDVTDDMLNAYNKGYSELKSKYPDLDDTDTTDYIGEADDELVELINSIIGGTNESINEASWVPVTKETLIHSISDVLDISIGSNEDKLTDSIVKKWNDDMVKFAGEHKDFSILKPEDSAGLQDYQELLRQVLISAGIDVNESFIENEWSPRNARTIMSSIISTLEVPTLSYDNKLNDEAVNKFNTAMTAYVKKYPGFEFRAPENSKGFTEFQELLKQALVDSNLIDHYNRIFESKVNESLLNRIYMQVYKSRKDLIPGLDDIITPYVDSDTVTDEINVPDEYKAQVESEVKDYLAQHEFQITEGAVLPVEDMAPLMEPVAEHCQNDITAFLDGEVEDIDAAKAALIQKIKSGGYDKSMTIEMLSYIDEYYNEPDDQLYKIIQDLSAKMHGTSVNEDDGDPEDIKSAYQAEVIGGYSSPAAIKKVASQFGKSESEITDLLKSAGADVREDVNEGMGEPITSLDDLMAGKEYYTPSGMGGRFSVKYDGKVDDKHQFTNTQKDYKGGKITYGDADVLQNIFKGDASNESLNEDVINENYSQELQKLVDCFKSVCDSMKDSSVTPASIWVDLGTKFGYCDDDGKLLVKFD